MVGHRKRVHEALVGRYDAGAKALCQCKVHEVVDRSVVRNGEPNGVGADGLVRVPLDRHVGHGGKQLAGCPAVNLVEPDLAPNRVSHFGSK